MNAAQSRFGTRWERLGALLAVAAVLLRCIIAPGLMLDLTAAARGELKLVICTPAGTKSIGVTAGKELPPGRQGDTDLCPYATPAVAGKLADPPVLAAERVPPAFEATQPDAAFPSAKLRAFTARAPPAAA
jgi:hypothetical protein